MNSNKTVEYAGELCKEHDCELLYLSKFGSHLYGTNTPESDTDYKGIFLPSKKRCLLHQNIKHITRSTGESDGKNDKKDIDIQMWSLQYFLEMVAKGETNALDLLFSFTYEEMIQYQVPLMKSLFDSYNKLFNTKDCNAFVGYALGQAKKYGIKGSRLGAIKKVYKWIQNIQDDGWWEEKKLGDLMPEILRLFSDKSYCFQKEINGTDALILCGKVHLINIKAGEFCGRICKDYEQYGERARAAERSEGIDWKALSHAYRALVQMEELIEYGKIEYPLESAFAIMLVKTGRLAFSDVETIISEKIDKIKDELESLTDPPNRKNSKHIQSLILGFYEEDL